MRRIIICLSLVTCLAFSACARSDKGPSLFDALDGTQDVKSLLPVGPVQGPEFQILPDVLLVYGRGASGFSVETATPIVSRLASYTEEVDEISLTGAEIVEKVAREYSVDPRLLMALLDYRSGWVQGTDTENVTEYPITNDTPSRTGLFRQLSWAANELNRGFYSRRVGGLQEFSLMDGSQVQVSQEVNDASAALQYVFGKMLGFQEWQTAVGPLGVYASYLSIFGDPSRDTVISSLPADLIQPELQLPFKESHGWFFTSGPHSAWSDGAAWAALDFAPDEDAFGCFDSQLWVTAVADGLVVRSADGQVIQDLDGDGDEGTGWTVLYMHIAGFERIEIGEALKAGDRIGHPSCEGGPSNGTHLHLARRFDGEWVPADQDIPFVLSGWTSKGDGVEYDGSLIRGDSEILASGFPTDENKITP
jgi:murein DD-endopeptidase MepM/ murein hydrolase activator NlpD